MKPSGRSYPPHSFPVLVDANDGFGDVKNVTRTIRGYENLGERHLH